MSRKLGIIAISYNRPNSLKRLLTRLNECDYCGDIISLIISIDNSGKDDVKKVADTFEWRYGTKIVKYQKNRLGLRHHILKCGSYINEFDFDAVAVFEDDIVPSRYFYEFMKQSVEKYDGNPNIAGISLYSPRWNVNAGLPFEPDWSGKDVFFMQYAQSWGQIWTANGWNDFLKWYDDNCENDTFLGVPDYVNSWPNTSWLKYHIAYCVQNNKYFLYPYISLSTCYADVGQHSPIHVNIYQVPVLQSQVGQYRFAEIDSSIRYDVYWEREEVFLCDNVTIDIYGTKRVEDYKQYVISSLELPFKVIDSYGYELRPHERNVIDKVKGNDIWVYDTSVSRDLKKRKVNPNKLPFYFKLDRSGKWFIKYVIELKIEILKKKNQFFNKQLLNTIIQYLTEKFRRKG